MESEKFTSKEKRDLAIQTGLQLIPYVGGAMSTAYFGRKQEIRFKRIESFYQGLAKRIKELESSDVKFVDFNYPEHDVTINLIEKLHDQLEREVFEEKNHFYENYFMSVTSKDITVDLEMRYLFLDALHQLSIKEIYTVINLADGVVRDGTYFVSDDDIANIFKVVNLGLVEQRSSRSRPHREFQLRRSSSPLAEYDYAISRLGRSFYHFCLTPLPF